jgi:hypothetical protein
MVTDQKKQESAKGSLHQMMDEIRSIRTGKRIWPTRDKTRWLGDSESPQTTAGAGVEPTPRSSPEKR